MTVLRDYQTLATNRFFSELANGYLRAAIQIGTGGGKSLVAAAIIKRRLSEVPGKCAVLVHRAEILEGLATAIAGLCPELSVGLITGSTPVGQRVYQASCDVVCISTATLAAAAEDNPYLIVLVDGLSLVTYDEAHRAVTETGRKCLIKLGVLDESGDDSPLIPLLGLSATLWREDSKKLMCGHPDKRSCRICIFQRVAYEKDLFSLIDEGYLTDVEFLSCFVDNLDLTKVKSSRIEGELDFTAKSLDEAMVKADAYNVAAKFILDNCTGLPTLAFVPNVRASDELAEILRDLGMRAESVTGKTHTKTREAALKRIQLPREDPEALDVIVNVALFTEGTDLPSVSCIVLLRPTRSKTLFRQIIGRALRLHKTKSGASRVIDLVGALTGHNLASAADLSTKTSQSEAAKAVLAKGGSLKEAHLSAEQEQAQTDAINAEIKRLLDPHEIGLDEFAITGSHNLYNVNLWAPHSAAKDHVEKTRATREAVKIAQWKPRSFPGPPRRGIFLDLSNTSGLLERVMFPRLVSLVKPAKSEMYLLPLDDWQNQGSRLDGSYLVVADITPGKFFMISYRKDRDQFDFINPRGAPYPVEDPAHVQYVDDLDLAESAAVAYGRTILSEEKVNFILNPASKKRKATASPEMIRHMSSVGILRSMLAKCQDVTGGTKKMLELAPPRYGVALDWVALRLCEADARRQVDAMREWLRDEEAQ